MKLGKRWSVDMCRYILGAVYFGTHSMRMVDLIALHKGNID